MVKIILKETVIIILGALFIMGVAGVIDFFRGQPIDWEERIFMSGLTAIFIRLIMWGMSAIDKKESD